eukprot:1157822-Pelagomonas_calceolata.AAC.29
MQRLRSQTCSQHIWEAAQHTKDNELAKGLLVTTTNLLGAHILQQSVRALAERLYLSLCECQNRGCMLCVTKASIGKKLFTNGCLTAPCIAFTHPCSSGLMQMKTGVIHACMLVELHGLKPYILLACSAQHNH